RLVRITFDEQLNFWVCWLIAQLDLNNSGRLIELCVEASGKLVQPGTYCEDDVCCTDHFSRRFRGEPTAHPKIIWSTGKRPASRGRGRRECSDCIRDIPQRRSSVPCPTTSKD